LGSDADPSLPALGGQELRCCLLETFTVTFAALVALAV
jgi:hypothetical protein